MFRKKFKKRVFSILADSTPVIDVQSQTIVEDNDGNVVNRVAFVPIDVTSKDCEDSLPNAKDYTLDKLLQAGVTLDNLSISQMFNPTDFATYGRLADIVAPTLNIKTE